MESDSITLAVSLGIRYGPVFSPVHPTEPRAQITLAEVRIDQPLFLAASTEGMR
jgi:hypothetical protein